MVKNLVVVGTEVEGRYRGLTTVLVDLENLILSEDSCVRIKDILHTTGREAKAPHLYLGALSGGALHTEKALEWLCTLFNSGLFEKGTPFDVFTIEVSLPALNGLLDSFPVLFRLFNLPKVRIVLSFRVGSGLALGNAEVKVDSGKTCYVFGHPEKVDATYAYDEAVYLEADDGYILRSS